MHTLYYLGIIFVLGALVELLSPKLSLPKVVGYLILGLIIGPEVLGIVPQSFVHNSEFVIDMSLSIIAVLLGASLKYSAVQGVAKQIIYITFFQSTFAFLIVSIGFYLLFPLFNLHFEHTLVISMLFGALSAATAPAATMAVVHELKAKGRFTTTLLGVVALDDAMSLIIFAFAVTTGSAIISRGDFHYSVITDTLEIIFYSGLIGVVGAIVLRLFHKLFSQHKGMETIATLGVIFIVYSVNISWHFEALFSALVMGVVISNMGEGFDLVEEEIDNHLEEIIFMLFFILSAMHLDLSMLSLVPFVLLAYIILRLFGKFLGVYVGGKLSHADKTVQNYLGLGLFPQAGLAIGLALSLQYKEGFETIAVFILNVVIATTIIHELIGPILTKWILKKSGEAQV